MAEYKNTKLLRRVVWYYICCYTKVMKFTPFLDYVLYDIFGQSELVTARSMMGAYILYYEGKAFAIVEKEELYFEGNKELARQKIYEIHIQYLKS